MINSNGLNNKGKTEYVEIVDSIVNIEQSLVEVKTNNLKKKIKQITHLVINCCWYYKLTLMV